MPTYHQALIEGKRLLSEDEENPEYDRGVRELLARLYGDSVLLTDGDTQAGVARIVQDMGFVNCE